MRKQTRSISNLNSRGLNSHGLNSQFWAGEVGIEIGFAFFIGQSGENRSHAHWAHQCIVRLDQPFTIISGETQLQANAIFVPAGIEHRLIATRHLSLFFDPTSTLANALCEHLKDAQSIQALPPRIADFFQTLLHSESSIQNLYQDCLGFFKHHRVIKKRDPRLPLILQTIRQEVGTSYSKRKELAQQIALSDSRFSHWFREQTGMPLRSYRKWLRLIVALEMILNGSSAINAAHAAGFSDQAHFSRSFLAMFGVSPQSLLPHLQRRT